MAEGSGLKLIIEKGPREGETLKYSQRSVVKLGRVVRGNTIAIKDAGISSKHICIQFDNELSKWTLCDLDSSNGTILNGQTLQPHVPSALEDGDCIKIGELTSIIVKIGVESPVQTRRNPRRQGKQAAGPGPVPTAAVEKELAELDLGFAGDLAGNDVKEPVPKRNLRSRAKKTVDSKNEVESLSSMRILRSSKKVNADAVEIAGPSVPVDTKKTRRRKKVPVQPPVDAALDEGNKAVFDKLEDTSENVENSGLVSPQKDCEEKEVVEELEVPDNGRWLDLEKMTLGDFFDYMEVQLPKEIYDRTEKIIADMKEKARRCHEFRVQRNESGKGKLATD